MIDSAVTVDLIRNGLRDYGVIYWKSHGNSYSIQTGELVTPERDTLYRSMGLLTKGEGCPVPPLVTAEVVLDRGGNVTTAPFSLIPDVFWAVTHALIGEATADKLRSPFVFLDACSSMQYSYFGCCPELSASRWIAEAFKDRGAAVALVGTRIPMPVCPGIRASICGPTYATIG